MGNQSLSKYKKSRSLLGILLLVFFSFFDQAVALECPPSPGEDKGSVQLPNGPIGADGYATYLFSWGQNLQPFGYIGYSNAATTEAIASIDIPKDLSDVKFPCLTDVIGTRVTARRHMYFQGFRWDDSSLDENCDFEFSVPWTAFAWRSDGGLGGSIGVQLNILGFGVVSVGGNNIGKFISGTQDFNVRIPVGSMSSAFSGSHGASVEIESPANSIRRIARVRWSSKFQPVLNSCGYVTQVPFGGNSAAFQSQPTSAASDVGIPSVELVAIGREDIVYPGSILGSVRSVENPESIVEGQVDLYDNTGTHILTTDLIGGIFRFVDLEPGAYYIRTSRTGYHDELAIGIPCLFGKCEIKDGSPIEVTNGSFDEVHFELNGSGGDLFFDGFEGG